MTKSRKHTRFAASAMGRVLALMRQGTMDRAVIADTLAIPIRKVSMAQKNLRRDGLLRAVGVKRHAAYIVETEPAHNPLIGVSSIFNHRAAG